MKPQPPTPPASREEVDIEELLHALENGQKECRKKLRACRDYMHSLQDENEYLRAELKEVYESYNHFLGVVKRTNEELTEKEKKLDMARNELEHVGMSHAKGCDCFDCNLLSILNP